jgi:hypothetical protein
LAVVATLTKGYDLDYMWRQIDRSATKDAAGYYIQASENGGNHRAAGGARARKHSASSPAGWSSEGLTIGCSANERPQTAPRWAVRRAAAGKPPTSTPGCLEAEPHATAERKRELRLEAVRQARQGPLYFMKTVLSKFRYTPGCGMEWPAVRREPAAPSRA